MKVSIIVATAENNVIGTKNKLPWYLSADLKHFKATTLKHHIVFGQNTFESIGRVLPDRTTIILSNDPNYKQEGCIVVRSPEEVIEVAKKAGESELFICGGGMVYKTFLPLTDKIYLTKVNAKIEGDVFFPELPENEWKVVSREPHEKDERNQYDYEFQVLERDK